MGSKAFELEAALGEPPVWESVRALRDDDPEVSSPLDRART